MAYLLDTCAVLWLFEDSPRLPPSVRKILIDPDREIRVSVVSALEVVLKHQTGRLKSGKPPSRWFPLLVEKHFLDWLYLDLKSVFALEALPWIHRDPFDRLLAAQAATHQMILVTPDRSLRKYPIRTLWSD